MSIIRLKLRVAQKSKKTNKGSAAWRRVGLAREREGIDAWPRSAALLSKARQDVGAAVMRPYARGCRVVSARRMSLPDFARIQGFPCIARRARGVKCNRQAKWTKAKGASK
jgi:hypothetical protein